MTSVALITHREVKILLGTNRQFSQYNTEQLVNVIIIKGCGEIISNYN